MINWLKVVTLFLYSVNTWAQTQAKSTYVDSDDLRWQATIIEAQHSLPYFRTLLSEPMDKLSYALVKVHFEDQGAYLWFIVIDTQPKSFIVSAFETLPQLPQIKPDEYYSLNDSQIVDWAINRNGKMYGGFSMRFIRDQKPLAERQKYDEYIGVTEWMPNP